MADLSRSHGVLRYCSLFLSEHWSKKYFGRRRKKKTGIGSGFLSQKGYLFVLSEKGR